VKRVSDGDVALKELDRCKTRLKASRRMSMQTNSSCASHAALNVTYGLPANDWRSYDERIDAVSIQDLANFASKYFREEERVELVIGALE
jgi:zinc protease